jgi:formylglycine-generating enzyme required for sulfatase activity
MKKHAVTISAGAALALLVSAAVLVNCQNPYFPNPGDNNWASEINVFLEKLSFQSTTSNAPQLADMTNLQSGGEPLSPTPSPEKLIENRSFAGTYKLGMKHLGLVGIPVDKGAKVKIKQFNYTRGEYKDVGELKADSWADWFLATSYGNIAFDIFKVVVEKGGLSETYDVFIMREGSPMPERQVPSGRWPPLIGGGGSGGGVFNRNLDSDVFVVGRDYDIKEFFISSTEVTETTWRQAQSQSGYSNLPTKNADSDYPVTGVNWYEAVAWCNAYTEWFNGTYTGNLEPVYYTDAGYTSKYVDGGSRVPIYAKPGAKGFRLPTELEWEFAARGGEFKKVPDWDWKYSGSDNAFAVANLGTNQIAETGTKSPNSRDLYDMSGNVSEWCWDWYTQTVDISTPMDGPSSGIDRKVVRGGDYTVPVGDAAKKDLVRTRSEAVAGNPGVGFIGFRTVRSISD